MFPYLLAALVCAARPTRPPMVAAPRAVDAGHLDESQSFDLVLAAMAGGGSDSTSPHRATHYAGVKFGQGCCARGSHPTERADTVTLDVGWDRVRSRDAVTLETSLMIGVVRFPRAIANRSRRFVRIYAEPGAGLRVGGGSFGYFSAKTMIALMSDQQVARFGTGPVIEIQHRFPFNNLARGDTRILIGVMAPLCKHCGFD